jgi:sugar phosphate isomerase/epimerase
MARKISLAYLTVPGIDPLTQIEMASKAGYDYISLRTIPMGQEGEPQIHLEKDPELFQKIKAALGDAPLKPLDIELVRVKEDFTDDYRGAFECAAKLGFTDVLSSIWTTDHGFAVERYGKICEDAKEFGLTMNLEFPVISGLKNLPDTLAFLREVGAGNAKILLDMLYCYWSGLTVEELKKVDPKLIGVVHLCDCPRDEKKYETVEIMREAREYVGHGVIPIKDYLKALPETPCSIELPNKRYIAKYGQERHIRNCLTTAREYLESAGL